MRFFHIFAHFPISVGNALYIYIYIYIYTYKNIFFYFQRMLSPMRFTKRISLTNDIVVSCSKSLQTR